MKQAVTPLSFFFRWILMISTAGASLIGVTMVLDMMRAVAPQGMDPRWPVVGLVLMVFAPIYALYFFFIAPLENEIKELKEKLEA